MLKRLLIANRGEIAIRIARAAGTLGIETVAIHASDDAACLHLRHADRVVELPGTGVAAYLDIDAIVAAALHTACDAVHPGYGLLSERADFAQSCAEAGLVFVGPAPDTLRALGDKTRARAAAIAANVPVVPGRDGLRDAADLVDFLQEQDGAPVLLKAAMGGGGRGMRVVSTPDEAEAAFDRCRAEAESAFGDARLYGERLLRDVRHIEVQIIGDGHGVAHLWERDCSLQRRHQKLVEFAPAPNLSAPLRAALLDAATRIGTATGYRGLGTVEFLATPGADAHRGHYFIEVNPRLQVEHTVTEQWLGVDLVAAQLRLAGGETLGQLGLPDTTAAPPPGQAMQLRINAERMTGDGAVIPSSGTISHFLPPGGPGVRVDSHGYAGYRPHPGFDSLLAKLIVSTRSDDPAALLGAARRALAEFHIGGVETNTGLLGALLTLPDLAAGSFTTATIADNLALLTGAPTPADPFFAPAPEAPDQAAEAFPQGALPIRAPMQAVLVSLETAEGEPAAPGQVLAIVEAMKMQHEITAPRACRVLTHLIEPGATLDAGQAVLLIEEIDAEGQTSAAAAPPDPDHIRPDLKAFLDRIALTRDENRGRAVARRRARGQRTARENIADLTGGGDFLEYGALVHAAQRRRRPLEELRATSPADGIVTGIGRINGDLFAPDQSRAAILAYDGSVMAGTQGFLGHKKTDRLLELARVQRLPVVFFTEGGGGRPGDEDFADVTVSGLDVMTFNLMTRLTSDKPSIAVNSGYCFAGNAAVFGACDIRIATTDSRIGLGGPAMVEAAGLGTHSPRDLGPARTQAEIGLVDLLARDEAEATALARRVFGCFQGDLTGAAAPDPRHLRHAIPENRKRVYDMRAVISALVDTGSFIEMRPHHGPGMITALVRLDGHAFGLIANNPVHLGGALDAPASRKGAEFLTLCARFALPVISLCDTPGFMVGPDSEAAGAVKSACELMAAGAQLADRLFTVVLRKGYGIGAQAMAGGSFAAPAFTISWPTGEFGAMGLEGAVRLGYKRELDAAPDATARAALFDRLVAQSYDRGQALNVASLAEIDAVIDPADTRDWLLNGLRALPR